MFSLNPECWRWASVLALLLLLAGCEPVSEPEVLHDAPEVDTTTAVGLTISMLDVGQGDAVLLQAATGQTALYDGGPRSGRVLEILQQMGVKQIDLVVASHPHEDHIGGLVDVITYYEPQFVIDNTSAHPTQTYERYLDAIESAGTQLLDPTARTIRLGEATLRVVPPPLDEEFEANDTSVGLLVEMADFSMSLFGDAERHQWAWLLEHQADALEPVNVHKASHHGSRNGDTAEGIAALQPEIVLIGLSVNNRYGHPHPEALALYEDVDASIYRTDLHGTIRVEVDEEGRYRVFTGDGESDSGDMACLDVNEATAGELQALHGIGPARAEAMVAARPFDSLDGLTRVQGIGPGTVEGIASQALICAF